MECPVCNGEMWDNRAKKTNPKAPDFKCKDKACTGVIWPPKRKNGTAPTPQASSPAVSNGGGDALSQLKTIATELHEVKVILLQKLMAKTSEPVPEVDIEDVPF